MKGIVLAGGRGSRLFPVTQGISKQLLPIYDKPMIYYSLSILMLSGIRDILIICNKENLDAFQRLLENGAKLGINIEYSIQDQPRGIADAFIVGEKFIGNDSVCLILGDNIFWGGGLTTLLDEASKLENGARIFSYQVKDPENFGVINYDENNRVISIEEKPINPSSNSIATGLYYYDNQVIDIAKNVKPSKRGEIEITSVNHEYLSNNELKVTPLGRGFVWFDTGTVKNLYQASNFVETIQNSNGQLVASLEEIALNKNWITKEDLERIITSYKNTEYAKSLKEIL